MKYIHKSRKYVNKARKYIDKENRFTPIQFEYFYGNKFQLKAFLSTIQETNMGNSWASDKHEINEIF